MTETGESGRRSRTLAPRLFEGGEKKEKEGVTAGRRHGSTVLLPVLPGRRENQ